MASPLLSYSQAADEIQRYIQTRAQGDEIPLSGEPGSAAPALASPMQVVAETVPLSASAGRVLAEGIRADRNQPPFPRSTRDGYACRAAEANTHRLLLLAGEVRAGQEAGRALNPGEVWEIMTGAPVPDGADAVFMVEHAERSSNFVHLREPRTVESGENIVPAGAEARAGDLLVSTGLRLTAAQIALAAQCGYHQLAVTPKPRVAILSTGDELVPVDATPGPSQIRNSNTPMLSALVSAAGADPIVFPAVPDQAAALDAAIATALCHAPDLLIFTGGVSAGRFDLVEDALTRAGARFFFDGVAIQPGKPVVFGQVPRPADSQDGCESPFQQSGHLPIPFFALPGNPISSAATFHLFAAPLLAALCGDTTPHPRFALAQLSHDWRGKPGLTRFLPAWCDFSLKPQVRLIPWHGSGDLAAFSQSNCLLVLPAEAQEIPSGSFVQILLT